MTASHPIPDAALETDIAILGKKGRGKSYTARGLVERLLDQQRRVVVLDPLSTWWGLKAGEHGYSIPVIGGPYGDLALDKDRLVEQGAALGKALAVGAGSAVIDLGSLRRAELVRFARAFLEELYTINRDPLWLVLEEADVFAPQQPQPETAALLGEVDRIARRGRAYGFRLITLTQRPAKLHKDVLTQLSTLIALGITSPQDRDAIKAWVEGAGDRERAKEVLETLASLKVGEGWVWAPDQQLLERVTFPPIRTPDTSATPKAGERRPAADVRGDVDVAALRAALAPITVGRERVEIAAPAMSSRDLETERQAMQAAFKAGAVAGLRVGWRMALDKVGDEFALMLREIGALDDTEAERLFDCEMGSPAPGVATMAAKAEAGPSVPKPRAPAKAAAVPKSSSPQQRVLDALGWWRAAGFKRIERARACVVARYSPRASTFGVVVGELVKAGLVTTGGGKIGLSEAGLQRATVPRHASWEDLREAAESLLGQQAERAFRAVCAAAPAPIRRDEVATQLGLSTSSSTIGVYLGKVAALGLIEKAGAGQVRAAPWLFGMGGDA